MVSAAEILVLIGILTVVGAVLSRSAVALRKSVAFVAALLIGVGATFGGLAWAGVPAFIEIPGVSPPVAGALWQFQFLTSSDTDRTELSESIINDGRTIVYAMTDANADGLGDINLDARIANMNAGDFNEVWPFEIALTFVDYTLASGAPTAAQYIVNRTFAGSTSERYAVTYTLTDSGEPTLTQIGERATSNDWKTGLADTINIDLEMYPLAMDDLGAASEVYVAFDAGGIVVKVVIREA